MAGKEYSIRFSLDGGVSKAFANTFKSASSAVSTLGDKVNQYNRRAVELKKVISKREDFERLTRTYDKQRQALTRYTEAVILARNPSARLIELQEKQKATVKKTQKAIEKQRESLAKLNQEMRTGGASTAFLKEQQKVYEARGEEALEALRREERSNNRESWLKAGAMAAMTYGAYKVADFAKSSVPVGGTFDETLQNVSAMKPTTTEEKIRIREAALNESEATRLSPTQYLQGLNVYRARGFGVDEAITANRASAQLAMASGLDITQTSDAIWRALDMFGESSEKAAHFADVYTNAMKKSELGVQYFFKALETAGFEAKEAGMSFESFNRMVATLGPTGANLNQVIKNAAKVFKNAQGDQAEYLKLLGLKTSGADGKARTFDELVVDFGQLLNKHQLNEIQTQRLYRRVFGDENALPMQILVDRVSKDREQTSGQSITGTTNQMAQDATSDFNSSVTKLQNAVERLQISVFDSFKGPLQVLVDKLTGLTNALANFTKKNPELTAAASGGAAVATTAASVAILKKLASIFTKGGATSQAGKMATAHPYGRVAALVAALFGGFLAYRASKFDVTEAKADVKALQEDSLEVPGLAEGGVVTKPTLAWVGEGRESEAILPLSKLQGLMTPNGVTVNFSPVIHLTGSQDAYGELQRGLAEGQASLKAELERLLVHQRRLSFM